MKLRISVSWLDSTNNYLTNDEMSEQDFITNLFSRGETKAMAAGTAFHSLLENALSIDDLNASHGGFEFELSDKLTGNVELGIMREKKYVYPIFPDVDLVGKIDAETVRLAIDHKLTDRTNLDRYLDAMQWRAYLIMRNKPLFAYQVFEHSGLDKETVFIKNYDRLELSTYQGIKDDVCDCVNELKTLLLRNIDAYKHYRGNQYQGKKKAA